MTTNPASQNLSPKAIMRNNDLQKKLQQKERDDKEGSVLRNYLIDPLRTAGAGTYIFYNLPKLKMGFSPSAAIFVASGVSTLADKSLKYCDGYNKLSTYITKDENKQKNISRKIEKNVERLSFGLQAASLYLIFRNFLRKRAKSQISPLTLSLTTNPFLLSRLNLQYNTTAVLKPAYTFNDICEKINVENAPILNPVGSSAIIEKNNETTELTYYQVAMGKLIEIATAPKELIPEISSFRNFCISSVREKLSAAENFKKKIINGLADLFKLVKSQIENYFVKI